MGNEPTMKAKHTPGPWELTVDPCHYDTLTSVRGGPSQIRGKGIEWRQLMVEIGGYADPTTAESNARLIAAAPDLLEAVTYQLDLNKWIESADAECPFFEETLRLRMNVATDYMTAAIAKATGKEIA
jgi:hypothetical protein